ncbi:alpha/beta-hydrolase [Mycena floridula]|nr:alpha/beta-hydrolase [Mycena floridula]
MRFNLSLQLVSAALAAAASNSSPRIQTSSGIYVGVTDVVSQIDSFKGIRYAEAPKRFSPAQYPSQQSKTELNAVNFGNDCPQFPSIPGVAGVNLGPPLRANQSEDCLFLNIWRPSARSTTDSLPVLVYIHGGGYFAGSGSEWDGTGFIRHSVITKKPVIFISINYRLGSLGFLGSAQMPIESLNLGLQDQRIAFRWIQENAKTFGGDPNRITIMGESAGGGSVHMHYLYPDSKQTFRAGISDSGTALVIGTPSCDFNDGPGGPYTLLGNLTGCGSGQGSFRCMQDLPFEAFWQASLVTYSPPSGIPPYSPCKGPKGSLIEEYPAKKVIAGDFLDLPLITGTNSNEGTLLTLLATQILDIPQPPIEIETAIFTGFVGAQTVNGKNLSQATIGNITALFPHMEPKISNSSLYERAAGFLTDFAFLAPQRLFLDATVKKKQQIWAYDFQQLLPGAPEFLGVFHSSELYYLDIGFSQVPTEKLATTFQDLYIAFVNEANPGQIWPKYDERKMVLQLLDKNVTTVIDTVHVAQTGFLNSASILAEFGRFG